VVENRSGAAGNIALEIVARAPPDGYNVLVSNVSTASINPIVYADTLKFDPVKELTGVTLRAAIPDLLVPGAGFPANSFKELVGHARARSGQLNYSTPLGGCSHLDVLDLAARTGMQLVNVLSKGVSLKAIFPWEGRADQYRDHAYHGGIFSMGFISNWIATHTAHHLLGRPRSFNPDSFQPEMLYNLMKNATASVSVPSAGAS